MSRYRAICTLYDTLRHEKNVPAACIANIDVKVLKEVALVEKEGPGGYYFAFYTL